MTIALVVYGISWTILVIIFLYSKYIQGNSTGSINESWYINAIAITLITTFAPLIVIIIPYLLFKDSIEKKKNEKWHKEKEEEQRQIESHRKYAFENYKKSTIIPISSECVRLGHQLDTIVSKMKYMDILTCLNKLRLPTGYTLEVKPAEHKGSGDRSHLVVKEPCGDIINDVMEIIGVDDSPLGAIQVYLLYSIWHYLPLFWHANYSHRTYIYTKDDIYGIRMFRKEEQESIINTLMQYEISPIVAKNDCKYYVSCCFWTDFGGLIREFVEIEINNNKIVNIFDIRQETLFKYECGIRF